MRLINSIKKISSSALYYFRGRVALVALLRAMDIGKGKEVLLQAFTCVANPEAVMAAGATPVYVDIEADGVNMDPVDLKRKISSKTGAVIVQHTFGIPANMEPLLALSREYGVPVIEDCCHSLTSQYNGKTVGSFGVGSYYSFEWGKPIVAGIGGALIVNDLAIKEKVCEEYGKYQSPSALSDMRLSLQYLAHKLLYKPRMYWLVRSIFHRLRKVGVAESNYNPIVDGPIAGDFSLRMSRSCLGRLKKNINHMQSITEHSLIVSKNFAVLVRNPMVKHVAQPDKSLPVYCRYPLIVENKPYFLEKARRLNIEMAEWYMTPIHPLEREELDMVKYTQGDCPNAEERCGQLVSLPVNLLVDQRYIERISKFFNYA